MNKKQKEVQQVFLNNEKEVLKQLEKNYAEALADINHRLELLMARQDADMAHVIYQIEHQRALRTQVQAILENLQANEFETISEYLANSYTDGFVGAVYDIHGQGIPLIIPIDQKKVVEAIQHDTELSESLYTMLGHDMKTLRKEVASEISRGISSGLDYVEISRNIEAYAKIPKNHAMTIARTEAHRIQCKATSDAQYAAKEKGADVVKQWESTLDGFTRPTHRQLDGQLRELDEKFNVDGKEAKFPGGFGRPEEDINCRCALLQRARWALDEGELNTLKERAEFFKLDKSKEFEDFKKKYLKASERVREGTPKIRNGGKNSVATMSKSANDTATDAIKASYEYRRIDKGVNYVPFDELDEVAGIKADFTEMDERLADVSAKQFAMLSSEYDTTCQKIVVEKFDSMLGSAPASTEVQMHLQSSKMAFNKTVVKDYDKFEERMQKAVEVGQFPKMDAEQFDKYVVTHEFAHTLMDFDSPLKNYVGAETKHIKAARKEIIEIHNAYKQEIYEMSIELDKLFKADSLNSNDMDAVFEQMDLIGKQQERIEAFKISKYADMSVDEFMAEAFADAKLGSNPSEYSKKVEKVIDKYFKK